MTQRLMPKATAVWLIDNSALTFEQIGAFCNLHPLEVQSIADGEAGIGIQGYDPVINGQITRAELDRCAADSTSRHLYGFLSSLQSVQASCSRSTITQSGQASRRCRW